MEIKPIPPDITRTAFACPHCGVLATQKRYALFAMSLIQDAEVIRWNEESLERLENNPDIEDELRQKLRHIFERALAGTIVVYEDKEYASSNNRIENLTMAQCFACKDYSVWVRDKLVHLPQKAGIQPHEDMPEGVRTVFDEARSIINLSPRASVALLRLALQKLCKHIRGKDEDINSSIQAMVNDGLDERVHHVLDLVRMIGNNALHPGEIDLSGDRTTALRVLEFINLITEQMISQPKRIKDMVTGLPERERQKAEGRRPEPKSRSAIEIGPVRPANSEEYILTIEDSLV